MRTLYGFDVQISCGLAREGDARGRTAYLGRCSVGWVTIAWGEWV
jgi:hypothetical protein